MKIGFNFQLGSWNKTKLRKNSIKKITNKKIEITPSVGFFYHKDYQTALFALSELDYSKKNAKGNFVSYGLGAGYLRTFLPNVYEISSNNKIEKIHEGKNYFLTNYFIVFGKDFSLMHKRPIDIYLKPQIMYALPNYSKGTTYFAFEVGVSYKLPKCEVN